MCFQRAWDTAPNSLGGKPEAPTKGHVLILPVFHEISRAMARKTGTGSERDGVTLSRRERAELFLSVERPTTQLAAQTMRGGAIATTAQILRMLLQIVSVAVLARLLLPEHFGLVAMGGSITAFIMAFTELNASMVTIQRDKLDQDLVSGLFLITIATSFSAVLIGAVAMPLASAFFHDPRVGLIIVGQALSAPIGALGAQHTALLTRNMKWTRLHSVLIGGQTIGIAASIVAAWAFDVGYWALIVQTWASAMATSALAWMACAWRPTWVRHWRPARKSIGMGLHLTGSSILTILVRQLDNILIGWRWGAVELGYYARAYTLLQTPLGFLTGPLSTALVPVMSQLQNDPPKWRLAYLDALAVITFVGGAMGCLLYGGAGTIVRLALGPGWGDTVAIFMNLSITMLAATPMRTTGWIYLSLGRTDRQLQWSLMATPVYLLSFVIGLPFGAKGVALGFSIAQLLAFFPCFLWAIRGTNIRMRDILAVVGLPTAATVLVALSLRAVTTHVGLLVQIAAIVAAGLIYLAVIAAAVWRLPVYARVKVRVENLVRAGQTRWARLQARRT
jgi:PST family polysaccharide transporter